MEDERVSPEEVGGPEGGVWQTHDGEGLHGADEDPGQVPVLDGCGCRGYSGHDVSQYTCG